MLQPAVVHNAVGDPQSDPAHPPDQPVLFCDEPDSGLELVDGGLHSPDQPVLFCDEPDSDLELVDGGLHSPDPDFRVGRVLRICQQADGSHFIRYL